MFFWIRSIVNTLPFQYFDPKAIWMGYSRAHRSVRVRIEEDRLRELVQNSDKRLNHSALQQKIYCVCDQPIAIRFEDRSGALRPVMGDVNTGLTLEIPGIGILDVLIPEYEEIMIQKR